MNCKPGDLAITLSPHQETNRLRDKLVTVLDVQVPDVFGFGPGWLIEGRLGLTGLVDVTRALPGEMVGSDMDRMYFPDAWLRPIRDPGPDAVDETLTWRFQIDLIAREVFA
jgi:hypothetical protein